MKRLSILFFSLFIILGCAYGTPYNKNECPSTDYHRNMTYFFCTSDTFTRKLVDVLNSGRSIRLIIPDGTAAYGSDRGYWIIFE